MLSVDVPNDVENILNLITPNFQENLQRNFLDEGARRQRRDGNEKISLDNIFFTDENICIEITNLNITTIPICNINQFQVDLEMFNIYIETNSGHIILEGDYKYSSVNATVPTSKLGKIRFVFEDVIFEGNVGIYIDEDSFVATNYDFNIKPGKILTEISCNEDVQADDLDVNIEKALEKNVSIQLLNFFYSEILHRQVAAPIVEYSVSELLIDEPDAMISISSERALKVNDFMDSLLKSMNSFFKMTKSTVLDIASLNIPFTEHEKYDIFECTNGQLQDLSTFVRQHDMSFYEKEGVVYVYGNIKLIDFQLKYVSCKAKHGSHSFDEGKIEVKAYCNRVFVKLSLQKDESTVNISVNKVQVSSLRDVDFNTFNLDYLKCHHDHFNCWIMGSLSSIVFPVLEQKINEGLTYAIKNRKN